LKPQVVHAMSRLHADHDTTPAAVATRTGGIVVINDAGVNQDAIDDVLAGGPLPPADCRIALVGMDHRPRGDASVLDAVRRLKADHYTVLCHAPHASEWPVGAQCRLLLAGAAHLFDSSSARFAGELRGHLDDLLQAAMARDGESRRIGQQMAASGVVGCSAAITAVFRWIVRASAVSDVPVLIVGETGTGKELAARAIHRLDRRRCDKPFVPVNCGAISASLAESELFGHRRGAFTGAEHDRLGLIRAARGGVVFLDEIGDLEVNLQGKLLRVLQEGCVLPIGDDHELPVDVRIIAATNRDVEAMVARHEFRADLFHRLNALSIRVPPLRERREDIEPLVAHFLERCGESGHAVAASAEFVAALRRLELPGNVRQLENIVRCGVVTARQGDRLSLQDLPPESWVELSRIDPAAQGPSPAERSAPVDATAVLEATEWKLQRALDLCEHQLLAAALGASRGNRARAARLLGISPRCIFNKMRKHRLTA
jgi:transcriptional regulator with GAF, ATPase, and Fis domain